MPVTLTLDTYDVKGFIRRVHGLGATVLAYAVTPNVDHLIRLHDDPDFRLTYGAADFVLLDSRVLAKLIRWTRRKSVPVCPGSDLVAELFGTEIKPSDPIVVLGGSDSQAQRLREKFCLLDLRHFNPPMGFVHRPEELERAVRFIEDQSPFRFCFLAVGSPQQEKVAYVLKQRDRARGLVLCVGASINFVTGEERRAPKWVQKLSFEWAYRLFRDPRRMASRYLVRGPRVFGIFREVSVVLRAGDAGQ